MSEHLEVEREARVDKYVADRLPFSRGVVQDLIKTGQVLIDGTPVEEKSQRVEPPQKIEVKTADLNSTGKIEPESGELDVVYEDEFLLAVNKPSGIIVHPAGDPRKSGGVFSGTLANRLLFHYPELAEVGSRRRAGLVHRLDRGTSGVLLIARSPEILRKLQAQFKQRKVNKKYFAVACGRLEEASVRVEVPLGRKDNNPLLRQPDPGGKQAVTRFEKMGGNQDFVALNCFPKTGRTHQIRVHAQHIGLPLLGDDKYGGQPAKRLMLHAEKISFEHPGTEETITLKAELPEVVKQKWKTVV